jgi:trimethylamine:corrinoid methyltransferase-like protein
VLLVETLQGNDLNSVDEASLTLSATVGARVGLPEAVERLAGAGAHVEAEAMVYGAGALESGVTFDYGKLLLDCEVIRGIGRAVQGLTISAETLALDVIEDVGSYGSFVVRHAATHARAVPVPVARSQKREGVAHRRRRAGRGARTKGIDRHHDQASTTASRPVGR